MAVYKRTYKSYSGPLTATWSRFLILPRYSWPRLFQSKFLLMYLVACFFYPLGAAAFIYLSHNLSFLTTFNIPSANLFAVNGQFFLVYCTVQGAMAYLLTAFVGPSLVAPDLANNSLPLYLGRPFSRAEYVLGKMTVLGGLLSLITWVPGLILFAIQASEAGWEWTRANFWLSGSIFAGLLLWVVVLSLIALAMSAWVKWRIAAGALLLGVFFVLAGFGAAINATMRTQYGYLIDLTQLIAAVWTHLFRVERETGTGLEPFEACVSLAVFCSLCLWLLARKLRAFEVVK